MCALRLYTRVRHTCTYTITSYATVHMIDVYTSVHGTLLSMEEQEPVFELQGQLECQGGSSYNDLSSTAHTNLLVRKK